MNNTFKFLTLGALVVISIYFFGCSSNNPLVPVRIISTKGAYILSEGTMSSPGKLSFYSSVKDTFYQSIYSNGVLGLYPDGMIFSGDNLFITEQGNFGGPGELHKLDTNGAVTLSSNPFGTNPYSAAVANNKIYVTNGPASAVSVLDANSLSLIKTINVGVYPQEILAIGSKVFVANQSLFSGGQDSTISVIDAVHDSVVATIVVRKNPSSLAVTSDGKLLVGCPGPSNIIYKIDVSSYSKLDSMTSNEGFISDISVDINSTAVYFIGGLNFSGDRIIKLDLTSKTFTTIINANSGSTFYGYCFDPDNKKHYVLDAFNFSVDGKAYIYDISNTLQRTFSTGVGPRRVVIRKD